MARKTYDEVTTHCVICSDEVPRDRMMREAYKRFRTMERRRPDLLYPEAFEDWKASGGTPTAEAFAEARKRNESKIGSM